MFKSHPEVGIPVANRIHITFPNKIDKIFVNEKHDLKVCSKQVYLERFRFRIKVYRYQIHFANNKRQ